MATRRQDESGSVIVLALLVTLIILGVGLTVMWVSSSGVKVSGDVTRRQEALYAAESGIERARAVLTTEPDWEKHLRGCTRAENDANRGNILCISGIKLKDVQVLGKAGSKSSRRANSYTVWIRNDWQEECDSTASSAAKVDCDGDGTVSRRDTTIAMFRDGNRRVIVRSEGSGRDGLSDVAVEVVLSGATSMTKAGDYVQKGLNSGGTSSAVANVE